MALIMNHGTLSILHINHNPEESFFAASERITLQARSFGYDESRKTHILGCFNSFDNLLHAPTIQFSVSELGRVARCLKST